MGPTHAFASLGYLKLCRGCPGVELKNRRGETALMKVIAKKGILSHPPIILVIFLINRPRRLR